MSSNRVGMSQRFIIDDYEPAYRATMRTVGFDARVENARRELRRCRVCPRNCDIDRMANDAALCHTGRHARVASAFPHHGEEDCLRGTGGSGTIFFAFCNLRCVFCQNWDISQAAAGREATAADIADLMLQLEAEGCHNINFVTPEHVAPQVVEAVALAASRGLRIPLVYNTSAYDSLASLRLMDGLIDIYMPDFKFWRPETARRLARAGDYPEVARRAITEMHRQVGILRFDRNGLAKRGVLVRHLVMPGQLEESTAICQWLAQSISDDTYVNIMGQYRPEHRVPGNDRYRDVDRRPTPSELRATFRAARASGLWRFDQPTPV